MTRATSLDPSLRPGTEPTAWFPVDEHAPATARRHVTLALRAHAVEGEVGDNAVLMVSELVTNVFQHTLSDTVGIAVRVTPEVVDVTVHESVPGDPVARSHIRERRSAMAPQDAVSGRGLRIVDTLATQWGADRAGAASCVWFTVDRT